MKARLPALLVGLLAACSGSEGGHKEPAPAAHRTPVQAGPAGDPSEQKLRAAQQASIEALCERLVDCSVEEAHANMSPEEVAKLDLENTAPLLRAECEDEGGKSDYSPRQIRIIQRCVNEAKTCDALHTCLEEAKKSGATSSR